MQLNKEAMLRYVRSELQERGSHGFDHVLRVCSLCELIGRNEHADMQVLIPAALFHDIGRPQEECGIPHEEAGARIAEKYLREQGYDENRIPAVMYAIRTHRYRSAMKPETLEARILSDADKLDAMGAVGIARTFLRAGEHRGEIADGIQHITGKLLHLKPLLYTAAARALAEDRHRILREFLCALEQETGASAFTRSGS